MQIRQATTPQELFAIRRFWYDVYFLEMGRLESQADQRKKQLADPLDQSGPLHYAERDGQVVGTVLTIFARDADLGAYEDFYGMNSDQWNHPAETSMTTKLMVVPSLRKSGLAVKLALATYEYALLQGIQQNFIDCNAHLHSFFLRLGYVEHRGWVHHKDFGEVCSMVLNVSDRKHLKRVKSPFVRILDAHSTTPIAQYA